MDTEENKNLTSDITFGVTSHYNQYKGFEVIDICEQLRAPDGSGNFNRGNAFKYLARAGWKDVDKQVQDLEKAVNYIQREIDRLKGARASSAETEKFEKAKDFMKQWFKDNPCPTCQGETRMTVGMVCRTCGRDYGNGEIGTIGSSKPHIDVEAGIVDRTAPERHWLDGMDSSTTCEPGACSGSSCVLDHPRSFPERMVDRRIRDGATPPRMRDVG